MKIEEFNRECAFTNKCTEEQLKNIFPWKFEGDSSGDLYTQLPSMEESLRMYEELLKKDA